jgi:cytosine/adenosine deaminase-related metal-dependent hydrolase
MSASPAAPEACDILIVNGYVITLDEDRRIFPTGAVAISGNRIVAVGREADLRAALRPRHVMDAHGAPVHPGYIETHCHATLHTTRGAVTDDPQAFAGLGDKPHPYAVWFNKLTDEDERASCLHTAAEMLLNGYTLLVEAGTVFEPDICAEAAQAVGLRASLCDPFLWDYAENFVLARQIERAPCSGKRALGLLGSQLWRNDDPEALVRGHVAIYGNGTGSDELTLAAKRCADDAGVAMSQHQSLETDDAFADDGRFGKHPLVHFAEIGAIGRNSAFVHMNILRDDEVDVIRHAGMSILWHPGNYQFYGIARSQRSRMAAMALSGINVSLCTDAAKIWTFGDMARIGYLVAREEGGYIPCERLLEMLTIGAARAVCLDHIVGSLEAGKRADIVIRRTDLPETAPGLDVVRDLTLTSPHKSVDTVLVDGKVVVRHGRLTLADEGAILAEARRSARRVAREVGLSPGPTWRHIA